mgnify:CR=1 FL=1
MAEHSPDPWRVAWRFAISDGMLVVLLVGIALGLTLTAWIPQQPSSEVDHARWLSQMQARFGDATPVLQTLGLFHVTSSVTFRGLLAVLAGILLLRVAENVDRLRKGRDGVEVEGDWEEVGDWDFVSLLEALRGRHYRVRRASSEAQVDRWPWSLVMPLAAQVGALLLLIGLLLFQVFGWRAMDVILQEGERVSLQEGAGWMALGEEGELRHDPGIVAFLGETGPGVVAEAADAEGEPLGLVLEPDAEPSDALRVALTGDAYFAIPAAELVVRLTPRSDEPYARADVQIYGSPTGEIIAEMVTDKGGHGVFDVSAVSDGAEVTLAFTTAPYVRATAIHNPGRLPTAVGVAVLVLGLTGSLVWTEQRFWVRESGEKVEGVGPLPTWLYPEKEDI